MSSARELAERCRWPDGIFCPRCRPAGNVRRLRGSDLFHCGECRRKFTVTAGTVLEHSRVPLEAWVAAIRLACSPDGVSARELVKLAAVTYKTAVGMMRRLRETGTRRAAAGGMDMRSFQRGRERRISWAPLRHEDALRELLQLRPERSDEKLDRVWAALSQARS